MFSSSIRRLSTSSIPKISLSCNKCKSAEKNTDVLNRLNQIDNKINRIQDSISDIQWIGICSLSVATFNSIIFTIDSVSSISGSTVA